MYDGYLKATGEEKVGEVPLRHVSERVDPGTVERAGENKTGCDLVR